MCYCTQSDAGTESSRPEGAEKVNKKERGGNFDPEKFYRICQRLQHFCSTPPAALAPVLKFPEVFVAIAVSFNYCNDNAIAIIITITITIVAECKMM